MSSFQYDYQEHLITDPMNVPSGEHHIIILFESVAVSDGWGGHSNNSYGKLYVFTDETKWVKAVQTLALTVSHELTRPKFVAYKCPRIATVQVQAHVSIG